ncbi:AAI domain-containing protein [Abeliophyllum distichum]|uniref:AAI domain-containing protein n=1 Tax=Abeliophyllum distichum TaxID=126358 RepID=A0ABD1VWF8_9LAMI
MNQLVPLKFVLFVIFLGLYPRAKSQWVHTAPILPPPLCAPQFAIVSRACSMLSFNPVLPPSPTPSPPILHSSAKPGARHGQGHGHEHGHRHRHGHGHRETPFEHECCRWLKEVDTVCVCGLLMHLPFFLSKPLHSYTVVIKDSCNVTFQC